MSVWSDMSPFLLSLALFLGATCPAVNGGPRSEIWAAHSSSTQEAEQDLLTAAGDGDLETVKSLIDEGVDVNTADDYGITPLMQSVAGGNVDLVKYLLSVGANVDARDNDGSSALLHTVDQHGQVAGDPEVSPDYWEIMRLLVKAGADVTVKDDNGETPLSLARGYQESEDGKTVKILQGLGATE